LTTSHDDAGVVRLGVAFDLKASAWGSRRIAVIVDYGLDLGALGFT